MLEIIVSARETDKVERGKDERSQYTSQILETRLTGFPFCEKCSSSLFHRNFYLKTASHFSEIALTSLTVIT